MSFNIGKIAQKIKNNAPGLWYSCLLISLLIFSIYFLEIKYFPIKSYDSLIALSLFVSFALVIIIFLLALPPLISSTLQKELINNEHTCSLLFSNKFRHIFDKLVIKKKKRRAETKLIIKPIKMFLILHIVNAIVLLFMLYFLPKTSVLITTIMYLISVVTWPNSKKTSSPSPSKITLIFYITIIITSSNLLLLITTGLINHLKEITPEIGINYLAHTISTYFCLLTYSIFVLIPFPDIKSKLQQPVILTLVIVALLTIDGSIIRLPKLIIETFRIGNMHRTTIGTDKRGCYLFKNNGLKVDCKDKKVVFLIPNINILWRIDEYVINYQDVNGNFRHLILNPTTTKIYDVETTG